MTTQQKYHRRQARLRGDWVRNAIKQEAADGKYYGVDSIYRDAKCAAWHAFQAHPELRELAA